MPSIESIKDNVGKKMKPKYAVVNGITIHGIKEVYPPNASRSCWKIFDGNEWIYATGSIMIYFTEE